MKKFNILEFLKKIIDDVYLFQKKNQFINIEHTGNPDVELDQKKLWYILVNLISNSMKYSPEGAEIKVIVEATKTNVIITVQDQGIGIPDEEQQYMFNKFFRAKNTNNVQGTGLGLTIVKRYVELMGGNIGFTSKVEEGTSFNIYLPKTLNA